MATRERIDRTTEHMCPKLAADVAYFKASGYRSYFNCVNCERDIPVQYVYFSMLCSECRYECTEDADVDREPAACVYCKAEL